MTKSNYLLIQNNTQIQHITLKEHLEGKNIDEKINALKNVILLQINNQPQLSLLMTIIKYCLPVKNHKVKKLVLYYWESLEKTDANGELLSEMILVCNQLLEDLQHANEYVRGMTLNFLSKVHEKELLSPLIQGITLNLSHRIYYVRRHAVNALAHITELYPDLVHDAMNLLKKQLSNENETVTLRNLIQFMYKLNSSGTMNFMQTWLANKSIAEIGDACTILILNYIQEWVSLYPNEKQHFIQFVLNALQSNSSCIQYQASYTLLRWSSSFTAIKQASIVLIELIKSHSELTVQCIALNQLIQRKEELKPILDELFHNLISCIPSAQSIVRSKLIELCVFLLSASNVDSFLLFVKKEFTQSLSIKWQDEKVHNEYQLELLDAISKIYYKHPEYIYIINLPLIEFVNVSSVSSQCISLFLEGISLEHELTGKIPEYMDTALSKLIAHMPSISCSSTLIKVFWLISSHAHTLDHIKNAIEDMQKLLNPLPLKYQGKHAGETRANEPKLCTAVTTIGEDGAYHTDIVYNTHPVNTVNTPARVLCCEGDFSLITSMSSSYIMLMANIYKLDSDIWAHFKPLIKDILNNFIELVGFIHDSTRIKEDILCQLKSHLLFLDHPTHRIIKDWSSKCLTTYHQTLNSIKIKEVKCTNSVVLERSIYDNLKLLFVHDAHDSNYKKEMVDINSVSKKLGEIIILSGSSDPIFIECAMEMNPYVLSMNLLLINQTSDTLQNIAIEFTSMEDAQLCSQHPLCLAPGENYTLPVNIYKCSTEISTIKGIVHFEYSNRNTSENNFIILKDIQIDILNYIKPATCIPALFIKMWKEFEWENVIHLHTKFNSLDDYIQHISNIMHMSVISNNNAKDLRCYASERLYAKSIFGSKILANLSLEMKDDIVDGTIRIRTEKQELALAIGRILSART